MTDLGMYQTALALATKITAGGCPATVDPRKASSGSVVLVPPPVRDYRSREDVFTLRLLVGSTTQDLGTLRKLSALLDDLRAAIPGMVEDARPTSYQLAGPDSPAYPAYSCRYAATIPQE